MSLEKKLAEALKTKDAELAAKVAAQRLDRLRDAILAVVSDQVLADGERKMISIMALATPDSEGRVEIELGTVDVRG